MRQIPLTQGQVALVDDGDFDLLNQRKWHADKGRKTVYARNRSVGRMHRAIMGVTDPAIEVDHEDGNGLNNQRYNLRVAIPGENRRNTGKYSTNTSGYKGVSWSKMVHKWVVQITLNHKVNTIGYYEDVIEAAKAYDAAAVELHGQFAKTNFGVILTQEPK